MRLHPSRIKGEKKKRRIKAGIKRFLPRTTPDVGEVKGEDLPQGRKDPWEAPGDSQCQERMGTHWRSPFPLAWPARGQRDPEPTQLSQNKTSFKQHPLQTASRRDSSYSSSPRLGIPRAGFWGPSGGSRAAPVAEVPPVPPESGSARGRGVWSRSRPAELGMSEPRFLPLPRGWMQPGMWDVQEKAALEPCCLAWDTPLLLFPASSMPSAALGLYWEHLVSGQCGSQGPD